MGKIFGTFSAVCLGVGVQLFLTFKMPPMDITVERKSPEMELREGIVFTKALLDTLSWLPGPEYTATNVDNVADMEVNFGEPRIYSMTKEAWREECTGVDIDDDHMGGPEAALDLLTRTSRVYKNEHTRGHNVIGCARSTYVPSSELVNASHLDLDRLGLHFDGEYHKSDGRTATSQTREKGVKTVSTFFSNFSNFRNTAPLHATMVNSKVVQCAGYKTWFFFKPDCCNRMGHHAYNAATLAKGFPTDGEATVITTRPGDVMTFGFYQHHTVFTWPGPSFMQTHRIVGPKILLAGVRKFGASYAFSILDGLLNNVRGGLKPANQAAKEEFRHLCENEMSEEHRVAIATKLKDFDAQHGNLGLPDF